MNIFKKISFLQLFMILICSSILQPSQTDLLDEAISTANFDDFKNLIEVKGADINSLVGIDRQPLVSRALFAEVLDICEDLDDTKKINHKKIVSYIINHPQTNVSLSDEKGRSPLIYAIKTINLEATKEIIKRIPTAIDQCDQFEKKPIDHAKENFRALPSALHKTNSQLCKLLE